jgi:hypothetical protein
VLWSGISITSEWVRNEASEGKRRGILVPVFLDPVDAPLAFRLLNGADLSQWQAGMPHVEFDKLIERVTELLGQTWSTATTTSVQQTRYPPTESSASQPEAFTFPDGHCEPFDRSRERNHRRLLHERTSNGASHIGNSFAENRKRRKIAARACQL